MSKSTDPGRSRMDTRTLSTCALMCALNVILARFMTVMPSSVARLSIEAVPLVLTGYFFGVVPGMLVGFVGDTIGCLFSGYGWNPILSVSPMMVGAFAGILRPLVKSTDPKWLMLQVSATVLPSKVLGSIYWTSQCLVWLGFSKKGLGALMAVRAVEALLEWLLVSLVVTLLLKTGIFRRMHLFPVAREDQKHTDPLNTASGCLVILQIALLALLDVLGKLPITNGSLPWLPRLGLSLLTLLPGFMAIVLAILSGKKEN